MRPACSLLPSSSNLVEGTSDLRENLIINKETLPTKSTASLYVLKQVMVNIGIDNNSSMTEMLVPIGMTLPLKRNLMETQMNPDYVVKQSEKFLKCNGCSAL